MGFPAFGVAPLVRRRKRHGVVRIATRHYNNHDAAHRVATLFEKWDCLIEAYLLARGENPPKRLNLYRPFAAVSLLEYGGLNPILPFLGGRSDAACRVVVWPSRLPPMGILRFLQRRGATRRYPPIRRSR